MVLRGLTFPIRLMILIFLMGACRGPFELFGQVSQTSGLDIARVPPVSSPGPPEGVGPEARSPLERIDEARIEVKAHPASAKSYLDLALALWDAGSGNAAANAIDHALKLDPHLSEAWYCKGLLEARDDHWHDAEMSFREAVRLKPDYFTARLQLGEALLRKGDFAGAKSEWQYIVKYSAPVSEAHYGLGLICMRQGDMTQAESEFRTALRLRGNQGYPEAAEKLGEVLLRKGKWEAAARIFKEVLAVQPGSLAATNGLATALARLGKRFEAQKQFAQAHAMLQRSLQLQRAQGENNQGLESWMAGDLQHAAESFRRALAEDPAYSEAHNNLGGVLWQQGERQEAIAEFRAAIGSNPDFAQAHNNLGNALLQTGNIDSAIKEFRTAIAFTPGLTMAHFNLGVALSSKGNLREAEKELRAAIALDPALAAAHVRLGLLMAKKENTLTDTAQQEIREGLRLDPALTAIVPPEILSSLKSQPGRRAQ